jgi:hypothetical protein
LAQKADVVRVDFDCVIPSHFGSSQSRRNVAKGAQ